MCAALGIGAQSVTIGWQVYAIARHSRSVEASAFLVGMVGLAQFAPLFLLTPFAGEAADRYDRRLILILCLAVECLCALALAVLSLSPAPPLAAIFAIAVVFGAMRAFPAAGALAPMLVPRAELPKAVAWNSLARQAGAVLGPVLAGLFIALSAASAYLAAFGLYALALVLSVLIRAKTTPEPPEGSRLEMIREGFFYVLKNSIVLGAVSLDLFAVLLGGATALLPVYARDILHVGPSGFGALRAAPALGGALAAYGLSRRPMNRHAGLWMFAGVAIFSLATLVFALSKVFLVSLIALAVLGGGDMLSVYVRQTLVMVSTPDAMRGRVSAISSLFIGASNELGEFETGVAARLLGPVLAAAAGGAAALFVTGLWARLFPALRRADRLLADEAVKR